MMKKLPLFIGLLTSSVLSSFALYADHDEHYEDEPVKPLSLLVSGGYDFGGDKLLEIEYFDGSVDTLRTGQGFNLNIGGELRPNASKDFSLRGTAGFRFSSNRESDVDATIYSFPIELSANWYPSRNLRFGVGYVEHLNTTLDSRDFGDTNFEDASGPKYEIAYKGFAVTFTNIDYRDQDGFKYSADTVGLSYSIAF